MKQINVNEFNPADDEPDYDPAADPATLGPEILSGSGFCIAHEGLRVDRARPRANRSLTVAWIHDGKAERLLVESFAYLPFLDYS